MSKNRKAITCNGRPAFFASMYEDIRECAMDLGWAVALHGSLASDMDIMAMPWTETAVTFERLIQKISKLFEGNPMSELYSISYNKKPHGRVVATIPIWEDFYLDISTIKAVREMVHEFAGFTKGVIGKKLPSDTTLNNMKKSELIELLHMAQHNYDVLMEFYANAVKYNMDKEGMKHE